MQKIEKILGIKTLKSSHCSVASNTISRPRGVNLATKATKIIFKKIEKIAKNSTNLCVYFCSTLTQKLKMTF